jgi:hypothetical protein
MLIVAIFALRAFRQNRTRRFVILAILWCGLFADAIWIALFPHLTQLTRR